MKKKIKNILIIIGCSLLVIIALISQISNVMYKEKLNSIKQQDENIVFYGDSITEGYNVKEFFYEYHVVNSGIGGNVTEDLINRIDSDLIDYNPSIVIIQIGTNDLRREISEKEILNNIKKIVKDIRKNRKNAEIYIESIYPINRNKDKEYWEKLNENYNNKTIMNLNEKIKKYCNNNDITYIDVYSKLTDEDGNLKDVYTEEGLHLNDLGYYKVTTTIKEYLKN